jgi:CTP-dependent riboflavin kinase
MAKKKKREYYFYKDYAKVSEQHIEWAMDNGMERQLDFFLKLKRNYQSGFIHNPLQQFKSLKTGVSKATFKRRLIQLENLGWIHKGRNYIRLISISKLPVHDTGKRQKFVKIHLDKLNYNSLRGLLIKKSERVQKFKLKHSDNSSQPMLLAVSGKLMKTNGKANKDVNLSCEGFANKINRSKATAHRVMCKLKAAGLLRTAKRYVIDPNAKFNRMIFEGCLYRETSSIIQTSFEKVKIKFVPKSVEEKVISMYTNDCF